MRQTLRKWNIRIAALMMAAAFLLCAMPAVSAAELSGSCGDKLKWNLSGDTLTITGSGAMYDYPESSMAPWYAHRREISKVALPDGLTRIGDLAFYGCSALKSVSIPNSVTEVGWYAFSGCSSMTILKLSSKLRTIEDGGFRECAALLSVRLPDSLTSIGYQGFYRCESLTEITIPASVKTLGSSAFAFCYDLIRADIQAPLTELPAWTFYGCSRLTDVILPNSLKGSEQFAFYGCDNLSNVVYKGSDENKAQIIDDINRDLAGEIEAPNVSDKDPGDSSSNTVIDVNPGTGGGNTQTPGTGGGNTQTPGTGDGNTQNPGTGGGNTQNPGTGGGNTQNPGTGGGNNQNPGTGDGNTQNPGTGGGNTQNPGTGGGNNQTPGTGDGNTQTPGTGGGNTQNPGTCDGNTQNPGTGSETPNQPGTGGEGGAEDNSGFVATTTTTTQTENASLSSKVTVTYSTAGGGRTTALVNVTLETAKGWEEIADKVTEIVDSSDETTVNVYIKDDSTLEKGVFKDLIGKPVTVTVHNAAGSVWKIDCRTLGESGAKAVYDLSYERTDASEKQLELMGCTVGYQIRFASNAQVNAEVMIKLPVEHARRRASLYQVKFGGDAELLQTVVVDDDGYAHFYLASVERRTVYLIGIDVPVKEAENAIIPESLLQDYGVTDTLSETKYVVTGRVSSWGMNIRQVTYIMAGAMLAVVTAVGFIMYALNKRKLKMGYVPDLDDEDFE